MEGSGGDYLKQSHVKINIIISGWVCIILGSLLLFSSGESSLVLSFAAPVSVLGLILLILGLMYKDEGSITLKRFYHGSQIKQKCRNQEE
tara:strand:- start:820 stop:1089 length:270 start_codon:yes stop_codon:yes gene_type:complete